MEVSSIDELKMKISTMPTDGKIIVVQSKRVLSQYEHDSVMKALEFIQDDLDCEIIFLPPHLEIRALTSETAVTFVDKQ